MATLSIDFDVISTKTGWNPHALEFLFHALSIATINERGCHATALTTAFCSVVEDCFGGLASSVLSSWKVYSSEDLGRMVFDLVGLKMMTANDGDKIEDFNGLFKTHERFVMDEIVAKQIDSSKC